MLVEEQLGHHSSPISLNLEAEGGHEEEDGNGKDGNGNGKDGREGENKFDLDNDMMVAFGKYRRM